MLRFSQNEGFVFKMLSSNPVFIRNVAVRYTGLGGGYTDVDALFRAVDTLFSRIWVYIKRCLHR